MAAEILGMRTKDVGIIPPLTCRRHGIHQTTLVNCSSPKSQQFLEKAKLTLSGPGTFPSPNEKIAALFASIRKAISGQALFTIDKMGVDQFVNHAFLKYPQPSFQILCLLPASRIEEI